VSFNFAGHSSASNYDWIALFQQRRARPYPPSQGADRLDTLVSRADHVEAVRGDLATARPCRWPRHDDHALVPVGVAYAEASGVPGINGLYATIVPLLAYFLFGPSRILILGPDSALAPVILSVVLPLSSDEPQRAIALAGMMAIVSGVVCIAAGLARLGFVTELLSKPIRYGYMNGIALTVLLSQIPKLFEIGRAHV